MGAVEGQTARLVSTVVTSEVWEGRWGGAPVSENGSFRAGLASGLRPRVTIRLLLPFFAILWTFGRGVGSTVGWETAGGGGGGAEAAAGAWR